MEPESKKAKVEGEAAIVVAEAPVPSIENSFAPIFSAESQERLRRSIADSKPYQHGVIRPLMDDDLLRQVRQEIINELHFTLKETDIYKVHQTGDLANLSGLDQSELSRLQALAKLRDALYSKPFRELLAKVSGSGPLSGVKRDMSINVYGKGCHLLTHDDVIGSRRISYILYLTDPDEPWQAEWGGALRLYPTLQPNIPCSDWTLTIPPSWNQLSFFKVQPGLSFHDVEEVYVDKSRMSISGWFHIPQRGEDGFKEGEEEATEALSSLRQLESGETRLFDFPKMFDVKSENEAAIAETTDEGKSNEKEDTKVIQELTADDVAYLGQFLDKRLLDKEEIEQLSNTLYQDSMLEIDSFLNKEYAQVVRESVEADDLVDGVVESPWELARPPHKARYLYIEKGHKPTLSQLATVFDHQAFTKWLRLVSAFDLRHSRIIGRRFRPGLDFSLATAGAPGQSIEATLSLTPSLGWKSGELGGYDLYLSTDENEEADPAVYRSKGDDDPVLLVNQAQWNTLHLVVRDPDVLRFVKYVSRSAPGSRWDVCGVWTE